jgi:pyruvate dehydrogenase E2 component (dihydrolipoamide acetyltransferase)
MATIDLTVPAKSPTMTEGTIVAWRVKAGDAVKSGQVVAEIQTDKAVVEWEALDGGTVAEILIPAGAIAYVNQVAAVLTTKAGESAVAAIAKAKEVNLALAAAAKGAAAPAAPAPVVLSPAPMPTAPSAPAIHPQAAPAAAPRAYRITPVAARFAAQHGLDLAKVRGSGPQGRITLRDVEEARRAGSAQIGTAAAAPAKPRLKPFRADAAASATEVAMSAMRQVIAKRLAESKATIPHFTVTEAVDAGALAAVKDQLGAYDGLKVTLNDLIVRAAALALRLHPKLNATFHGTAVRQYDSADICVAVAIPDGLITPIVAKAHAKSARQIGEEVRALAKKAAEGRLQPHEFQGGTFTVSNLGMFGIESFSAIINPPQVAILAVAGIKDEPVVRGGQVVAGKVLRLTLSADHRAVDGADAAAFLKTLRELLEAPAGLLV